MPKIEIFNTQLREGNWLIDYTLTEDDGEVKKVRLVTPMDALEWRAAEYNIDPADIDTLIDIIVCEQFLPQSFYDSKDGLYNAPNVDHARRRYIEEIAKIKLHYRVSTRKSDCPLNVIRRNRVSNPMDLAIKGAAVILERERKVGNQVDPHTKTVLSNLMKGFEQLAKEVK